jgi:hypothetical protein
MAKRPVPPPGLSPEPVEGQSEPNPIATSGNRRRIAKGKRNAPRRKPSKPQPLSTDVSSLFKDKP